MRYLIIGAVAGGASTAARLRRLDENATIILFEKGPFISYANCGLPYYIGGTIEDRNKLFVQTPVSFHKRFAIDVRVNTEVTSIDAASKCIRVKNLVTSEEYEEGYDKLVLAPGAEPFRPPLPGIDLPGIFTLRNVADTDRIKKIAQQSRSAVIAGAGFIGLEMAENLHQLGLQVTVVEKAAQVLTPADYPVAAMLQQHIRAKGITLRLGTAIRGFEQLPDGSVEVRTDNGEPINTDLVILSIGVKPDARLAKAAGLATGVTGGISVNEFLQTSHPDIYAVGDAIETMHPVLKKPVTAFLAGPANKQGRICANNIVSGNTQRFSGSIQTAIVKVFDMTVALTGPNSTQLNAAGIPYKVSVIHGGSHAGYYPGAKSLTIQLAFDPENGRIYHAQIAGVDGVDKRIDVVSAIIRQQGTIYDLMEFEQAYAPPFSSAKDPLNMAGFVADNIIQHRLNVFYWDEVGQLPSSAVLLDVRTEKEYQARHIPGALNIPVDELRDRLGELDSNRPIYIYCEAGLRGYLAHRVLRQKGFSEVYNLSGGFVLWSTCSKEQQLALADTVPGGVS